MNQVLVISILYQDEAIASFEFPFENVPGKVSLPDDGFYGGLTFFIGTDGHGGYEFTPDASEMWVRFNDKQIGRLVEYFGGKPHTLLFQTKKAE